MFNPLFRRWLRALRNSPCAKVTLLTALKTLSGIFCTRPELVAAAAVAAASSAQPLPAQGHNALYLSVTCADRESVVNHTTGVVVASAAVAAASSAFPFPV